LADLPVEEPMLLTELDGFLTGLLICPEAIPSDEWMSVVWGAETDGVPPFDDPLDVQWFADAVAARRHEIARDLDRGRLRPILDVDERNGDVLWEYWIDGFAEAMATRPDAWQVLAADGRTAAPLERLTLLIAAAREESELDSVQINALSDAAVVEMTDAVQRLHAAVTRDGETVGRASGPVTKAKVGRNDPCPCGSGKKQKHCCS
jgi:uncharacterized protein